MKKPLMLPAAAVAALAATVSSAPANAIQATPQDTNDSTVGSLAQHQLKQATQSGLAIYANGDDLFAFTLEQRGDGTILAQHRSHYSHGSHSSHASHSSHYSGR